MYKSYGTESKLAYLDHALVENCNCLTAAAMVTQADGYAEREAALLMLAYKQKDRARRTTVGADNRGCWRDLHISPTQVETAVQAGRYVSYKQLLLVVGARARFRDRPTKKV